jgi:hypothetical protein
VVIGCVSRESSGAARGRTAERFILTDTRSDPPASYLLEGDRTALAFHAGHTVEIAGRLSGQAGAGRGTAAARRLSVQTLVYLSENCLKLDARKD